MSNLYTVTGYTTNKMRKVKSKKTPFQALYDYQPGEIGIDDTFTKETIKPYKAKVDYFLAGSLKNNIRNNDNLIEKQLIVLDYDNVNMLYTKFMTIIKEKLAGVSFLLYPTISNYVPGMGMRFRLVIDTDRTYSINENKKLLQNVIDYIGITCDSASQTYSQLMGLPILNKLSKPEMILKQIADPLKVDNYLYEPAPKAVFNAVPFDGELSHETAVEMVQAYADRVGTKLLDRGYYLNPYMNIKHAYQTGEIDLNTVEECLEILAVGNSDWAANNFEHFKKDLGSPVTNGTPFTQFFGWVSTPTLDFSGVEFSNEDWSKEPHIGSPSKMRELYNVLYQEGEKWREEHTTVDERTNKIKVPPVSPRAVANILKKHVNFAIVTDDDPEAAPLCAYDLDEGIYKRGERFIGKMILKVEATTNKAGRTNILGWLEIESPEKEPTRDESLIVMNNGIFDRVQMRLIPFTPNYVFLTKVAVDYNPNAIEPIFPDWSFSKWLEELSDGDPMKVEQMWRVIYACINGNYISQKLIFFYSEKGKTGKGTIQAILRNLIGRKNTAAIRLNQFETRWGVYNVVGKSLMIGDDNHPKDFIERCENLKSVAVGEYVQAEGKGKDAFYVSISAQIVQSFNGLPRINAFDDGFKHRLILIPFKHSYQENENRKIKNEYVKNKNLLEWIALKVVHMKNVELFNTADGKEALKEYEEENNNVLQFYNEFFRDFTSERLPIKFLFELYQAWNREENNPTNTKQRTFTKDLRGIVEPNGWIYARNSLAPLNFFHESDQRKLDSYPSTDYFASNPKKQQPLIKRDAS